MRVHDAYIKEIVVDNYKSLKNSKVEFFDGLNIIIGENGAGKSNLLDFINRFASKYPSSADFSRQLNTSYSVVISYMQSKKRSDVELEVKRAKRRSVNSGKDVDPTYPTVTVKHIADVNAVLNEKAFVYKTALDNDSPHDKQTRKIFYSLECHYISFDLPDSPLWLSRPCKITIEQNDFVNINEEPYSSFGFIREFEMDIEFYLLRDAKKVRSSELLLKKYLINWFDKYFESKGINSILQKYTIIKEIRVNPNINIYSNDDLVIIENLTIEFLIENDWMPWSYLSDGSKRLFYLISVAMLEDVNIVLIEEPELGIHPHQLYKVVDFLKEHSANKQIIISTHSPLLLDCLKEEELNRIIIAENKKGSKFRHLNKGQIEKARRYMEDVGDLSYYWLHSDLDV